jgi:hypothetical protein
MLYLNSPHRTNSSKKSSLDNTRGNIPIGFRVAQQEEAELQALANELSNEFLMDTRSGFGFELGIE